MKFVLALLLGAVASQEVFDQEAVEDDIDNEIADLFEMEEAEEAGLVEEEDLEEDLRITWSRKDAANIKAGKLRIMGEIKKLSGIAPMEEKELKGKLQHIGGNLEHHAGNWKNSA